MARIQAKYVAAGSALPGAVQLGLVVGGTAFNLAVVQQPA
jgi:hypothetical protein